jgi:adenine-specific DNA-methyltransferase
MPFLDWVNKTQAVNIAADVPYHLLQQQSLHGDSDSDNMLIQGDNLLALKALLPFYRGKVKCIYIDPPYNTQSAFTHYDDKLEHSQWLTLMYPRLVVLRELLAEDGSIWVSIDDREAHYLKVLMDEVFGRGCFVASNVWQKRYSRENREAVGDVHEYIILYVKDPEKFKSVRNLLPIGEKQQKSYKNPNNDPRGLWQSVSLLAQGYRPNQMYEIVAPSGKVHLPPPGNCWKIIRSEYDKLIGDSRVYFGKDGKGVPRRMEFLDNAKGLVPWTWWPHEEVGHTDESKKECNVLFGSDVSFGTPKPERLIERILHIATNPGDLVLDSFLGSGTTAAVAHKMGRRWIGIEMGEHAVTHCLPRMEKVIAGEQGGISKAVNWQGSGGFRFHTLGEPVFDANGAIHPNVKFASLAGYLWHFETGNPLQSTFEKWGASSTTQVQKREEEKSSLKAKAKFDENTQPLLPTMVAENECHSFKSPFKKDPLGPKGDLGGFAVPLLGIHNNTAYYLLYNGILGDRRPQGGNVLTSAVLAYLDEAFPHAGARVIYGETTRLGEARLRESGITFKQIPYDIKAR